MSKPDVQPHNRRLRRRAASLLAATALLAAACGDSSDTDETSAPDTVVDATTTAAPATGSPAATPFDRTDVICEKHSPPAGTRNSSSPGVTADAIVISDASPDVAALKKVGVELIDHHLAWQAVVDTINEDCGGINGRKIILESALLDPLSADMPAHFQATCLKITEDQKAFLALGTTGGPPMARCIAVDHKTIYDNPAYPIDADMRDSEGRVMSMFNTGESLARAFIADGAAGNAFDGKKIMVLGVAGPTPLAAQQQQVQYVDGFKTHDIDVDLELLPCAGADCTQGIGNAIRRIKQEAPDLLVFSHYLSGVVLGPVLREMRDQELEVVITGPANQSMSDGVMGTIMKAAGEDAVKWAADNGWTAVGDYQAGEWRVSGVGASEIGTTCNANYAKAMDQAPYEYNETNILNSNWTIPAATCIWMRQIARAIYSLGNEVTTEGMVEALRTVKAENWFTSELSRDRAYFSWPDTGPDRVATLQFNYPCPLPTTGTLPCFMPMENPVSYRTVES
jgi:hypothetical protein